MLKGPSNPRCVYAAHSFAVSPRPRVIFSLRLTTQQEPEPRPILFYVTPPTKVDTKMETSLQVNTSFIAQLLLNHD